MAGFEDRLNSRLSRIEDRLERLERLQTPPVEASPAPSPAAPLARLLTPPISAAPPATSHAPPPAPPVVQTPSALPPGPSVAPLVVETVRAVPVEGSRLAALRALTNQDRAVPPSQPPSHSTSQSTGQPPALPAVAASVPADPTLPNPPAASPAALPPSAPPTTPRSARVPGARPAPRPAKLAARKASGPPINFETLVGGRWFAVLGALAVTIAIGLFLKLAYDNGFLRMLSPAARCLIGAGFGFALLLVGEAARRRINAWASVGLSAAGIAGIYSSVLAAYGLYEIIPDSLAFGLLAATSGLGMFIAARSRLAAVAVLSILGAYLTPFLFSHASPNPLVFPAYLIALLGAGLGLGSWLRAGFRVAASVAWWGTFILGAIWVLASGASPWIILSFLALAWGLVHAAHVFATRPAPGDPDPEDTPVEPVRWRLPAPGESAMLASSFAFTSWAVGLAVFTLQHSPVLPDWLPPVAAALVTSLLAVTLSGHLRVLTDPPVTGRERLGAGLLTQTAALVIAAVALASSGPAAVFIWFALGLSALFAGRWIGSRALNIYGLLVLGIGSGRLLFYESWASGLAAPWRDVNGLVLSVWMGLMVVGALAWLTGAILMLPDRDQPARRGRSLMAVFAAVMFMALLLAACCHQGAAPTSISIAWLVIGAGAALVAAFGPAAWSRRLLGGELGVLAILLTTGKLLLLDAPGGIASPGTPVLGLVPSTWMLGCELAAAVWLLAAILLPARRLRDEQADGARGFPSNDDLGPAIALWLGRAACGMAFVMAMVGLLNRGAEGTSIAIGWIVLGVVAMLAAPLRPGLGLAFTGPAVLALALARLLMIDSVLNIVPAEHVAWGGLVLTRWSLAMALAGGAWLVAGLVSIMRGDRSAWGESLAIGGGAACAGSLMLAVTHAQASGGSILWAWLAVGAIALVASPLAARMQLHLTAAGLLLCGVLLWAGVYMAKPGLDWTGDSYAIVLHPGLWSALLLAAGVVGAAYRQQTDWLIPRRFTHAAAWVLGLALVWAATSLEAGRLGSEISGERATRMATVSIWWGLFACGLIGVGFARQVSPLRRSGLVLMISAALKVVAIDLHGVQPIWRVVSFLLLGLLMLGIAAVYGRLGGGVKPVEDGTPAPGEQ